jgi:hypothetical protein
MKDNLSSSHGFEGRRQEDVQEDDRTNEIFSRDSYDQSRGD